MGTCVYPFFFQLNDVAVAAVCAIGLFQQINTKNTSLSNPFSVVVQLRIYTFLYFHGDLLGACIHRVVFSKITEEAQVFGISFSHGENCMY
jgi:hypothetical protein